MKDSLEDPAYVARIKAAWPALPTSMSVVEYCGTGDPFSGGDGDADDRGLGRDGRILPRSSSELRAEFKTIEEAHAAAKLITNRRPNSTLGVTPTWRRDSN